MRGDHSVDLCVSYGRNDYYAENVFKIINRICRNYDIFHAEYPLRKMVHADENEQTFTEYYSPQPSIGIALVGGYFSLSVVYISIHSVSLDQISLETLSNIAVITWGRGCSWYESDLVYEAQNSSRKMTLTLTFRSITVFLREK